ncbi:hypothetical protein M404DRAFT_27510 [Pisolithus tinctorius Marx 270]|uniref:Uncharacterized protein n=1 Tax=Pisolithus tinctorius Marx 270 TaxID=870435 RepID=A0A0C3J1G7_PISTI|nr:hypothetical protein M404DRAFT_27510 [Pisolithus tinctorius Marx 270]
MAANHAPHLSQLICAATPDPIEVEKATLREKFITASAALVAEAKCMLDDRDDLWEEKGKVFPLAKCSRELDVDMRIDVADGPVIAEVDEAYKWWGIKGQGTSAAVPVVMERMSHVEVLQPACKMIAESIDDGKPKAPKAGPSKWAHDNDNDNDIMEVVEGKTCRKDKAPVCGGFNGKTTADISQALGMVRAEAMAVHAANLHLQVRIEQLSEALAKLGVE